MRLRIAPTVIFGAWLLAPSGAPAMEAGSSWLKIPMAAREAALGGGGGAFAGNDSVGFNPAGLAFLGGSEITLSQSFWVQGFSLAHLVYGRSLPGGSGFAIGMDHAGFGEIAKYGVSGGVPFYNGSYSPLGLNFFAGYGGSLSPDLRAGVAAQFLYDDLQTRSGESAALDAGLLFQVPGTGLFIQTALHDLGFPLDGAPLPSALSLGVDYRLPIEKIIPGESLALSLEENISLWDSHGSSLGLGGEYRLNQGLAFRAGYRFSHDDYLEGLSGLSFGAGIRYLDWSLDYALTTLGDLGTAHQISLSLSFGGKSAAALSAGRNIPKRESPNFPETLHFDSGQDQISANDKEAANEAAQAIRENFRGRLVLIEGHTDNLDLKNSKFNSNQDLSLARAETVKEILVEKGLDPALLRVFGFGDSRPLLSNSTAEGRAQNRRVELRVYPNP
jgi:flagellar motor protein MotB